MTYYDMHSHLLPELDDGSESVEMSLQLIKKLCNQSVNNICLTPHYYSNMESISDFVAKRQESMDKLFPNLPKDVNVCVGAEVYVSRYLFNNTDLSDLCYGNSKYILCEFGFNSRFEEHTMGHLYRLVNNYGLTPVLTHVERYTNLMKSEKLLRNLVDLGVIVQSNIEAYKSFTLRRKLIKYLNKGYIHILGTDCHSVQRGNPDEYMNVINLIKDKCGQDCVNLIVEHSKEIFNKSN